MNGECAGARYKAGRLSQVGCVLALVVLAWGGNGCAGGEQADEQARQEIVVYAAASMTDALQALADSFEVAFPRYRVVLNVAATSLLARQIEQGAPADVFFSANLMWMDFLEERNRLAGAAIHPLANRLVVVGRQDRAPLSSFDALVEELRIALADPEHVPAGIYARQGFECAGLWEQVQPHVIPTLDVRAALLAVRNGAADAAVVYASDVVVDPNVQVLLEWPAVCQPDIRYAVARLRGAAQPEGAEHLLGFAADSSRAALWKRYGFLPL